MATTPGSSRPTAAHQWPALDAAVSSARPSEVAPHPGEPVTTTVHFWRRRMALETLVHRADMELAVGDVTRMDDELSADGVDELLWFFARPDDDHADGIDATSVVELTDGDHAWFVTLTDGAASWSRSGAGADATVRGTAPALLLALWGRDVAGIGPARFGVPPLVVTGDEAAYRRLLDRLGDD